MMNVICFYTTLIKLVRVSNSHEFVGLRQVSIVDLGGEAVQNSWQQLEFME